MFVQRVDMVSTPLPLPVHFSHAQQSFSLKKRRLAFSSSVSSDSHSPQRQLSHSLPPRPPSKGCPSVSRVFPQRRTPWTPLSCELIENPPPLSLYDPGRPQSFFSQCFINLGLIGRGSFGEVYKVKSLLDGRQYAVKRSVQRFRGEVERSRSIKEARNHERLHPHPHILGFIAAWEEGGHLYIQTELCCTSLLLHTENQPSNPGEACAWYYLCDLLLALDHLHSQGFAHMDLKPANVFLTRSGRLKLGDFGLLLELPRESEAGATEGGKGTDRKKREKDDEQEGDPRYMAPELLRGEYGAAADVFSLGVSILELSCNIEVPKGGEGWQQLRKGCLPSEFTNALSPELQDVLRLMLAPEPRERATVQQLLALPSVRKHRWRRQLSLQVYESWLSILTLSQFILSAGWSFLSSLNLPFIPRCSPPAPCTPPRESWEKEGDVSVLQHSAMLSDLDTPTDEPVFLPDAHALQHSPTTTHRLQVRLSFGSTSTPLPASSTLARDCLTHTPTRSLTHTPSSIRTSSSRHTLTGSPTLSPIRLGSQGRSSRSSDLQLLLSDSPASSRSLRSWAENEQKSGFEPKNLLNLFEDTTL
ncbi:membrane-associated tyrosine- and threonine-specific cdc2-inhibitory kinase [Astyanax mexicanus]|uniref:non-specific serine/threonine protein kinase n=1 Tax=Astyanax mexicanus TaxID=7994 RepID=A0A8T2LEE5_ASTMX|nr:membrane-associated tyrosine- and threonine-specific cdc2-inhibitory kinase [Astyanax mexicanus]